MLTEQQLENRNKGLGGSDAAGVIGWSSLKSPYDIWRNKTQQIKVIFNEAMRKGQELENHVRQLYEKETNTTVNVPCETIYHTKYSYILANPDGIISTLNKGLEIKTTANDAYLRMKNLAENKDWLCQVAHYCEVLKITTFDVFVFHVETHETKLYQYNAHDTFQKALIAKEVNFWEEYVLKNVPPLLRDLKDIKNHFKIAKNIEAVADISTVAKIKRLIEIHNLNKEMEEEKKALQMDIFLEMGIADTLIDEKGTKLATWKERANNRFDSAAFKESYPELFESFYITGTTRTFLPNYKLGE